MSGDEDGVVLFRSDADEHFGFPSHVHIDPATELLRRVEAIEARQRDHQMHDGSCPVRLAEKVNARGQVHMEPGSCDCWLSR